MSLRNSLGSNMGVIFDNDIIVERKAMRVMTCDGWKWQLINADILRAWDYGIDTDEEILNNCGSELEFMWLGKTSPDLGEGDDKNGKIM